MRRITVFWMVSDSIEFFIFTHKVHSVDLSSLLRAENVYGKINYVAGPCTDREEEKSYLTVDRGVFMPFAAIENDFAGSFCIGFLVDTSSSNTAPLAYFHDALGGILGNLTVLPDSIMLNIKGNEIAFSEETVGFRRYQLCREGDLITLYDDCSAVTSLLIPNFELGFDSVELLRDLTSSQPFFQVTPTLYVIVYYISLQCVHMWFPGVPCLQIVRSGCQLSSPPHNYCICQPGKSM